MAAILLKTEIPGPKSRALYERRKSAVTPGVGTAHPMFVASAKGATLTDVDGNTFLDFAGGIGVLNIGHANPDVVRAVAEQAALFTHACFQVTGYEGYIAVCEHLCRLTPGTFVKRAFLASTGAEAVENAIKIARGATKRQGVLAFEHGFHGRTLLALTLTGKAAPYKAGFGPYAGEVYRLPYPYEYRSSPIPHFELALATLVRPQDLACVILEPVLGEGGFVVAPKPFLAELRAFCDRHGILLIADEVQCGFGRTGTMFASEQLGLVPDLMVCAKSMAGGLPLSAVVGGAEWMDAIVPGGLGGTYAGNPIACAAALEAMRIIEQLVASGRTKQIADRLSAQLERLQQRHPIIGDVRGLGAMMAIELVSDRATKEPATKETAEVVARARQRGLILLSAGTFGNVIRFLPPLSISDAELDEGFAVLDAALTLG